MNPKSLLEQYDLNPKKSLGQNFLHDPNALEKIVTTAEIMPQDVVLEIGPGTGELTAHLATVARHVIAIEIDERMRPILSDRFADKDNVHFVFDDFLKTDVLSIVGPHEFVVVANVPYYITSQILRHILELHRRPRSIVLTVQYEVAERVIAKPGDLSVLAVSVQFYGKPSIASRLNPAVFWPRPDVESAILKIETYDTPAVDVPDNDLFFKVVKAGFSQKRKQLKNALSGGLSLKSRVINEIFADTSVDLKRRAETLELEEWGILTRAYADYLQR